MNTPMAEGHPFGPLQPLGRFEWERIIRQCTMPMQNTKLVAYTLATYADTKTGQNIHPGQKRLAAHTGISERRVRDHMQDLERFGLIHQEVKGSSFGRGGKGMASKYHLSAPAGLMHWLSEDAEGDLDLWDMATLDGLPAQIDTAPDHRTVASGDTREDRTVASGDVVPEAEEHRTYPARTPDSGDTNTGRYCPPTSSLPPHELNPHHSSSAVVSPAREEISATNDEDIPPDPEDKPLEERTAAWQMEQLVRRQAEYERQEAERKTS